MSQSRDGALGGMVAISRFLMDNLYENENTVSIFFFFFKNEEWYWKHNCIICF